MAQIDTLTIRPVLSSKGLWTIEISCRLVTGEEGSASIPEGTSKGMYEAFSAPYEHAERMLVDRLAPALRGFSCDTVRDIEIRIRDHDESPRWEMLGGNVALGVSVASARALAKARGRALWEELADTFATTPRMPTLYANMINGGLHAGNGLWFQEYLVIPREKDIVAQVRYISEMYQALRTVIAESKGSGATLIGDEGGFAPVCDSSLEPFTLLTDAAVRMQHAENVDFGLDAAASNIRAGVEDLRELYGEMAAHFPLRYLEDPAAEDDMEGTAHVVSQLTNTVPIIAGDDTTVTDPERIRRVHAQTGITGVIIKPNQNGTLGGAFAAAAVARECGMKVIASHRSGETEDTWIADVAYALGADGFKLGAPARGERTAKYNRLLAIERDQIRSREA